MSYETGVLNILVCVHHPILLRSYPYARHSTRVVAELTISFAMILDD